MTLLFCSGFCDGLGGMFDSMGNGVISTTQKRSGTYSFRVYIDTGYLTKTLSSLTEVYLQVCVRITDIATANNSPFIRWQNGSTNLGNINFNGVYFTAYTGNSATLVGTGPYGERFANNTWGVVEVYVKIAEDNVDPALAGRIIVRFNGKIIISFTGDTKPGAETTMDTFNFGILGSTWNSYTYFDDIIIDSSAWPNGAMVTPLLVTGAGTYAEWTPLTGANYECVDEVPVSIADYVNASPIDTRDTYTVGPDLPAEAVEILGVQVVGNAYYKGLTASRNFKPMFKNGAAEGLGTNITPTQDVVGFSRVVAISPMTSLPWTPSEINAMEVGIKTAT